MSSPSLSSFETLKSSHYSDNSPSSSPARFHSLQKQQFLIKYLIKEATSPSLCPHKTISFLRTIVTRTFHRRVFPDDFLQYTSMELFFVTHTVIIAMLLH